jgi:hypothetical protein
MTPYPLGLQMTRPDMFCRWGLPLREFFCGRQFLFRREKGGIIFFSIDESACDKKYQSDH